MRRHQAHPPAPLTKDVIPIAAARITRELNRKLEKVSTRSAFFQTLSKQLQQYFEFDRLCINLYDPDSELLSFFSAAEGKLVNSLSPVRKAEKTTVAGHVIASRKPVVITDIAEHFTESVLHPMAEAGLTTTMAFPLLLHEKIMGTLHCSFVKKPDNLYGIMELFLELCPSVAVCLGAVLSSENQEHGGWTSALHTDLQPVDTEDFIFVGQNMRDFMHKVNIVAKLDVPVLLLGETGTGKTHLAQHIHCTSKRNKQHFVKVNCPALASTLFESELFGHAKGAFTGASVKRVGRFELAHQGTLFLDEIAELSAEMQSKLLHVLDNKCFERVGESVSMAVDTRLVAATNVNIPRAVREGRLRSDFYHRLSACTLELPALRERREEIPVLAGFFVNKLAALYGLPRMQLGQDVLQRLQGYSWPGNIRELRNVINGLLLQNCLTGKVTQLDVDIVLRNGVLHEPPAASEIPEVRPAPSVPSMDAPLESLEEMEKRHIENALKSAGYVVSGPNGAAALLGLPRSTLQHRMRKLGISARKV